MRVISLFSGAGGMDLGFVQAGHRIVWANDSDHDCCETYRKNIGDHIVEGDISEMDSKSIPDGDIVIGGFPCQGFSMANLRRSVDDERNNLYLQFLRIVKDKRPHYFLAENVKGILSLDKGGVVRKIAEDFRSAGYDTEYRLLNMANYGVPETRQRVFFIGIRNDVRTSIKFRFPKQTHAVPSKLNENLKPWVTVAEALEGIGDPINTNDLANHECSQYAVKFRNFTGHRKTDPAKPSPTILARGNGKGGVCAIPHPNGHRRMSIRESATIQTFPKNFVFVGGLMSCYRQVGNAVPVLFAKIMAKQLKKMEPIQVPCE